MATAFQKIAISTALVMGCSFCPWAQAQSLNQCGNGPLMVGQKTGRYGQLFCPKL